MTAFDITEFLAHIAHEANRAYCVGIGDTSQVPWEAAPEWQRQSAREGVVHVINGLTPEALHQKWCDLKVTEGWKYGPVKNPEAKEHPCLVPYAELPAEQRRKDFLFRGVILAARDAMLEEVR